MPSCIGWYVCLTCVYCIGIGDYWPGEAENLLGNISEEARQAGRKGNKGSLTAGGKPRAKSAKVAPHPCCSDHSLVALCSCPVSEQRQSIFADCQKRCKLFALCDQCKVY